MEEKALTIVVATYNSEQLLPKVLTSIAEQDFDKSKLEVLIIDGGSSDNTLQIAGSYGCKVIFNSEREPVNAKFLGLKYASANLVQFLDHDEVLLNRNSLNIKVNIFKLRPDINAVIGSGYANPDKTNAVNAYINEFGDPFSFFIYRLSKNYIYFHKMLLDRYKLDADFGSFSVFDTTQQKKPVLIELCASGCVVRTSFLRSHLNFVYDHKRFVGQLFYLITKKSPKFAITKNDPLLHYSADSLAGFLSKIRWRVQSNVHHKETIGAAGFSGRIKLNKITTNSKKYLFLIYAFSIVWPFFDSIFLVASRRNLGYFLHLPLIVYTAFYICFQYSLKLVGFSPQLSVYDGRDTLK